MCLIFSKGSKLSEAELNLLIAYAHRWIMQLQRQLAEYQLLEEQHLTDALSKQQAEDDVIAASKLREALAEQQGTLTVEVCYSFILLRFLLDFPHADFQ